MSAACVLSPMYPYFGHQTDGNHNFFFWIVIYFIETLLDRKPILQEFFYEIFG